MPVAQRINNLIASLSLPIRDKRIMKTLDHNPRISPWSPPIDGRRHRPLTDQERLRQKTITAREIGSEGKGEGVEGLVRPVEEHPHHMALRFPGVSLPLSLSRMRTEFRRNRPVNPTCAVLPWPATLPGQYNDTTLIRRTVRRPRGSSQWR